MMDEEKVELTWKNKKDNLKESLLPVDSLDIPLDTSTYLVGDALLALKRINNSVAGKVDIIYIDPPYNTGRQFTYNDKFSEAEWLDNIYPLLHLSRELLSDFGIVFIQLDDKELSNVKILCSEVFGEANIVGVLVHQRKTGGGQAKYFVKGHDYILVIAKDKDKCPSLTVPKTGIPSTKIVEINGIKYFKNDDVIRRSFGQYDKGINRRCFYEELETLKGAKKKQEVDRLLKSGEYILEKDPTTGNHIVCSLKKLDEVRAKMYSIIKVLSSEGVYDLRKLEMDGVFSYPKPVSLLKTLIESTQMKNALVLDFFSGSGTTGQAVLELNSEDGGSRRFILVNKDENNIPMNAVKRLKKVYTYLGVDESFKEEVV